MLSVACGYTEVELTGQVFVVTKGGQNVKLGLVEVRAIPESEIQPFIKAKEAQARKELEQLKPLIEKAKTEEDRSKKLRAWLDLGNKYSYWTSSAFYFEGLSAGVASTKTDADGGFVLRLRGGTRYALAAKAQREIIDGAEEYYWLVWVPLDGKKSTTILLSNDNLLTSGSPTSVVRAEVHSPREVVEFMTEVLELYPELE